MVLIAITAGIGLLNLTGHLQAPLPYISLAWTAAQVLGQWIEQIASYSVAAPLDYVAELGLRGPLGRLAGDATLTGLATLIAGTVALNLWLFRRMTSGLAWRRPVSRGSWEG